MGLGTLLFHVSPSLAYSACVGRGRGGADCFQNKVCMLVIQFFDGIFSPLLILQQHKQIRNVSCTGCLRYI